MNEVLHLVNLDTIGGVEELFAHFLDHATPYKIKHHVLVTGGKIHPHFSDSLKKNAASITYEKYFLSCKVPHFLRTFLKKRAFGKNISHILLWNRFDDLKDLKKDAKVIYYEHGASWMHDKSCSPPPFFKSVDSILANSTAAKEIILQKWQPKVPIAIVENPIRPDLAFARTHRSSFHTPFRLGFIGRLIPLKGVPLLLHALKLLVDNGHKVELQIAGMGQEKMSLQAQAHTLGIEKHIQFLGAVQNVAAFYDSIDLLVMPSIREPLGLVALEASSRACPVIASYIDGLAEAVQDGKNGISLCPTRPVEEYVDFGGKLAGLPDLVFDPKQKSLQKPKIVSPEDIAKAIALLIDNPTRYVELSHNALDFAKKYPNFTTYTDELISHLGPF